MLLCKRSFDASPSKHEACKIYAEPGLLCFVGMTRHRSIKEKLAMPMPGDQPVQLAELLPRVYDDSGSSSDEEDGVASPKSKVGQKHAAREDVVVAEPDGA